MPPIRWRLPPIAIVMPWVFAKQSTTVGLVQKMKSKKSNSPAVKAGSEIKKQKNFREKEELHVLLNVYDLVWDKDCKQGKNAGLVDLGLGFFHSGESCAAPSLLVRLPPHTILRVVLWTGLELWGKEISFGHSKRYKSGVFAVKPKLAQDYMPNTRFFQSIPIATVHISRRWCVLSSPRNWASSSSPASE